MAGFGLPNFGQLTEAFKKAKEIQQNAQKLQDELESMEIEGKSDDDSCKMDHLMRVRDRNSLKWKQPPKSDFLDLHIDSIVDCKIDGE